MSAIATSADGAYIFLALEDGSGNPLILRATRSDLTTWTAVYEPGAGSAANVAPVPGNADKMLFYGNFGTDVGVILYTISTDTTSDISPASLGAAVVNTLTVNPSDENEIMATIDTDQELVYTADQGATAWQVLDAALGFDATALWTLWSGSYWPHRTFTAGDNGTDLDLLYSPNAGASRTNLEDATLGALTDITNVEVTDP